MPIQQRSQLKGFGQSTNEKYIVEDINDLINAANNSSGFGTGSNYIVIPADGTPTENGESLESAYAAAIISSPNGNPLNSNNQYYIVLSPGYYTLSSNLLVNTNYVNIISLTGLCDVFITGPRTLNVTATKVYIQGIDVGVNIFETSGLSLSQVIENCKGGTGSFGYSGAYGTYINCTGGSTSFGGNSIAGGVFIDCTAGALSFGGGYGGTQASGIFKNCVAGSESFGGFNGSASGTFNACSGANNSFGKGPGGNAAGIFTFCSIQFGSFPTPTTGRFVYCHQSGIPYNAGFVAQNNL